MDIDEIHVETEMARSSPKSKSELQDAGDQSTSFFTNSLWVHVFVPGE